ncbi:MAG: O-methyltransferase domain [Blastocatellia bacterium]
MITFKADLQPSRLANCMDLNMLVMTGGRERTESQYRELLAAAGFELTMIVEMLRWSFSSQSVICASS